jgi:hypothetical protein
MNEKFESVHSVNDDEIIDYNDNKNTDIIKNINIHANRKKSVLKKDSNFVYSNHSDDD